MLISLFCGPGGLDLGFKCAGIQTRLACDIDTASINTYRRNHPGVAVLKVDLSKTDADVVIREWDAISSDSPPIGVLGGPPCQSFTVSNRHQSEDDPRHKLPEHYARILAGLNKRYCIDFFVFENVPGLVSKPHKPKYLQFRQMFETAGFRIFEQPLDALDFAVPQRRRRIFIVGLNNRKYPDLEFRFPSGKSDSPISVAQAIGTLMEPDYYNRSLSCGSNHPNHWCMTPKSSKFSASLEERKRNKGFSFRILEWDKPSPTVAYGNREVHLHPEGHRRLSVFEAMLLQGFPRDYVLEGTLSDQIRLVSSAVAPPVGLAIARALIEQLGLEAPFCPED